MMQRVAVIADVHANLPALVAALEAIQNAGCETIYCLGDVIGIGPYPAECLELICNHPNVRSVMGNHDAWFAYGIPEPRPAWMSVGEAEHHSWTHSQLDPTLRECVKRWPYVRQELIETVQVTCVHYPMQPSGHDFVPIIPQPTPEEFDALFGRYRTPLVLYGHHHPGIDVSGNGRYVNPGSLGCSPDAIARFVLIEVDDFGEFTVEHRAVDYDRSDLFRQFVERDVPERSFLVKTFFGG